MDDGSQHHDGRLGLGPLVEGGEDGRHAVGGCGGFCLAVGVGWRLDAYAEAGAATTALGVEEK